MRAIIYSPTGGVYVGCLITGQCFSREDAAKHFDAMSPTFDSVEKARHYWTSFGDSDLQDVTFLAVPTFRLSATFEECAEWGADPWPMAAKRLELHEDDDGDSMKSSNAG